eukprot:GHUV01024242.1.p3 GENE.GHUV01024242.1~~GHUV01024242.1.p3  ORF type:complete len:102 (+),score=16.34 GHUV01024242.1:138-443(+)
MYCLPAGDTTAPCFEVRYKPAEPLCHILAADVLGISIHGLRVWIRAEVATHATPLCEDYTSEARTIYCTHLQNSKTTYSAQIGRRVPQNAAQNATDIRMNA